MANLIPLVTVPIDPANRNDVMNWLITQIAQVYGSGGTSGTPYQGGRVVFPPAG